MRSYGTELDKTSPLPLYYQLAELLRERIHIRELMPGDRLPPEQELSERLGISRMTVRQAIAYLVRDGTLVVRHGTGTFVAEPKMTHDALHLLGFTEETMRRGSVVASRVLEQAIVVPPRPVVAKLQLDTGETTTKIVRLRLSDNVPLLLETSFVPTSLYPDLVHEDLTTRSLYALLEERRGLRLQRARQILEATIANEYESELFGVRLGVPMILMEGVTYFEHTSPAEYFKVIYRGDRFKFELESQRTGADEMSAGTRVSVVLA